MVERPKNIYQVITWSSTCIMEIVEKVRWLLRQKIVYAPRATHKLTANICLCHVLQRNTRPRLPRIAPKVHNKGARPGPAAHHPPTHVLVALPRVGGIHTANIIGRVLLECSRAHGKDVTSTSPMVASYVPMHSHPAWWSWTCSLRQQPAVGHREQVKVTVIDELEVRKLKELFGGSGYIS